MLGEFTNWVVGYPDPSLAKDYVFYGRLWGTLYILVAILFTWLKSYRFLERIQTTIVALLLFCMGLAALFSSPDLVQLLLGTFIPTAPRYEPWLVEKFPHFSSRSPWVEMVVYLGAIGGGTQDYIGYVGLIRQKAWGLMGWSGGIHKPAPARISEAGANLARGLQWLRAPLVDVTVSFACILVFTLCFVVLGATILHPNQEVPEGFDLLTLQLGYLVRPDQSPLLQWLCAFVYKTGVFFAFFGTILGAYELYTWTTRECLVAAMPKLSKVPIRTFRLGTLLWCGLGGLALLWGVDRDPVVIVTPAALVGSALTCGLWCFAILWSDRVHVLPQLQMKRGLRAALWVAGVVLSVIPTFGIIKYVQSFF